MLITALVLLILYTVPQAVNFQLDIVDLQHDKTTLHNDNNLDSHKKPNDKFPVQFHPQLGIPQNQQAQSAFSRAEKLIQDPDNQLLFMDIGDSDDCFYDPRAGVVGTALFYREHRYQRQPYVSNGFIGVRIANLGQGFAYDHGDDANSHQGWPQFNRRYAGAFAAGFYNAQPNTTASNFPELLDNGWESIIAAIPQWTTLEVLTEVNGTWYHLHAGGVHGEDVSQYVQTMALGDGRVTTEFVWMDVVHIAVEVLANRAIETAGLVRVLVRNLDSASRVVVVEDQLDFATSQRCLLVEAGTDDQGIFMRVLPQGVSSATGTIFSRLSAEALPMSASAVAVGRTKSLVDVDGSIVRQKSTATLAPGTIASWFKTVGIATTDLDPASAVDDFKLARKTALMAYHEAEQMHRDACHQLRGNIVFPGDRLLTLAAQASLHHLISNTRPHALGTTAALGVTGLSSDSYGGMVFWDTDLWMLGGLVPFAPDHAASIVNYREHLHRQAQLNVPPDWGDSSYDPDIDGTLSAAVYPWTSGRYGNCTATGPCIDYEYHVNVAVATAALTIYLAGHGDEHYLASTVLPLVLDAAQFIAGLVQYNETLAAYTTTNLTDPDEYANHVDNGAYTNAGIAKLMRYTVDIASHLLVPIPGLYAHIASNMYLPRSPHGVVLEYSDMPDDIAVKQADVVMITYPLDNLLISYEEARTSAQYYALKQDRHGPAMTYPIYSAVLLALELGCSYLTFLRMAVQPFLRAPFAQFLEQAVDDATANGGTSPAFPFLTAHGGSLQAVVQGLFGLRFAYSMVQGTMQRELVLNPRHVPGGLEIHHLHYMNSTFDLIMNDTTLAVHHRGGGVSITAIVLGTAPTTIEPHSTAYFAVPPPQTAPGFALCSSATVYNITAGALGDTAILINDGYNFTYWQAATDTAKVLVDLHQQRAIKGGHINWGDLPPDWYSIAVLQDDSYRDYSPEQILGTVDFGATLHERYHAFRTGVVVPQDDVFTELINEPVLPAPPVDPGLAVTSAWNTTDFVLDTTGRFVLLQMSTAKIHQVILY